MDINELQAAAIDTHTCTADCVTLSETECGCGVLGPASQMCAECTAFYANHPGVL